VLCKELGLKPTRKTRVARVSDHTLTLEHNREETDIRTSGVVWVAGVRVNPLIESLDVEKDRRGLILVEPTLQVRGHENVFALGDLAFYPDVAPHSPGQPNWRFSRRTCAPATIRAFMRAMN